MRGTTEPSGTKNVATRRRRPWLPRLIRPVSPLAAVAIVSLLFGGAGFADAATGGAFILGKPNSETTQSSLSDKHGTPLSLTAPRGDAPLAVNRTVQVKNLNAEYVGGFRATQLAVTGGAGVTAFDSSVSIGQTPSEVATTGSLRSGIYYVSASAELFINPSDVDGACWIALRSNPDAQIAQSYVAGQGDFPVAEVSAVRVTAGDTLQEVCDAGGNTGSSVFGPNIFAIRVVASSNG